MPRKSSKPKKATYATANLGFEETLWATADKMRGHMDPAEYKHVVLGLIFLKYISDSFENRRQEIEIGTRTPSHELYVADEKRRYQVLEERDEYTAEHVYWVPPEARWRALQDKARDPKIGQLIDDAMIAIEKDNPKLKGVLPKTYARPELDKTRLGEILDLIGTIGLGDSESKKKDVLGQVYEYFLGRFASAEGKGGGEFYTPASVVKVLVALLEPYKGRVFDPCCGSGGMFVQSDKFVRAHGGGSFDISIYGQESNPTTWKLAKMNLAIRGIEADLGPEPADSFHHDLHQDLKADFILANPPFNDSDWGGDRLREDPRWVYGVPSPKNANYAWIQHFISHLAPHGTAGFILANGSMSSNQSREGEIRKAIIEADLVDCMISLPSNLFYNVTISACLWLITRQKNNGMTTDGRSLRDRRGETLFINARDLGFMRDRKHRAFTDKEIAMISDTYHSWRLRDGYKDITGFCKIATQEEIRRFNYILTPGRYVGVPDLVDDEEPFEEKMERLAASLREQFAENARLEAEIKKNIERFGYGGN